MIIILHRKLLSTNEEPFVFFQCLPECQPGGQFPVKKVKFVTFCGMIVIEESLCQKTIVISIFTDLS